MVLVRRIQPATHFLGIELFTLSVQRDFIAQHYLIGGDWGAENDLHSHNYRAELYLRGKELDKHGYLVDIVRVEELLEAEIKNCENTTLNDLPEFEEINPSLEHFSRILCLKLGEHFRDLGLDSVEVRLWENKEAWASYLLEF